MATSSSDDGFEIIDGHQIPLRSHGSSTTLVEHNLTAEPTLSVHAIPKRNSMLLSIQPPLLPKESIPHVPCDIVLVIDVSGSMGSAAPIPTDGDSGEDTGLSILDLTKHAANTIIQTLNENDRLAVVTFCTTIEVVFELDFMNENNKSKLLKAIDGLYPKTSTNLWHGILEGLKVLEKSSSLGNVQSLLVLTDGAPNHMCPAQGYVPKLRQMLLKHQKLTGCLPMISTFGFGYYLLSPLLKSIAEIGGGSYAFIPDPGMIGTVFVHAVANLYTTFASQAHLLLKGDGSADFTVDMGSQPALELHDFNGQGLSLRLGSLQYGQSRDIIIHYEGASNGQPVNIQAELVYIFGKDKQTIKIHKSVDPQEQTVPQAVIGYHLMRSALCSILRRLHPLQDSAETFNLPESELADIRTRLTSLVTEINASGNKDEYNQSIFQDIAGQSPQGQISLAVSSEDYYSRWGRHYLLSILNAHTNQICNSFKDPGPLMYGRNSPLFCTCRTQLDDVFDNLPPPSASRTSRHSPRTSTARVNMRDYNRAHGPCFTGNCCVRMADVNDNTTDSPKLEIEAVRSGMAVWTPCGARIVKAVLQTIVRNANICKLGSLEITPWHPIRVQGEWRFPFDVAGEDVQGYTGKIYSILLEPDSDTDAHAIMVEDQVCVTLGHGILAGDDVRAHEFFGNHNLVSERLELLPKLNNGLVSCVGIERSSGTGLACGFVGHSRLSEVSVTQNHASPVDDGVEHGDERHSNAIAV